MELNVTDENSSGSSYECGSQSLLTFQYYAWGITANIVSIYGIIGNIMSIIILQHHQMRNSTSYYLISLAVYDIFLLFFMALFLSIPTIHLEKNVLQDYYFAYQYMHPYVYPLALIAHTGMVYTTIAFTVERYLAVCKPLHAANTCTMSRTKRVIFIIFAASVIYNIPRFLEYHTTEKINGEHNRTIPMLEYTEIGNNKIFQEVYFIYSYLFIMFLGPFTVLSVLNTLLIRVINMAHKKRNMISSTISKETNVTVMVIVIINVFLVCQLPALTDNVLVAIFGHSQLQCSVQWVRFTTISNLLVVLNSGINFILYCMLSKRFRRVFIKIFCFCKSAPKFKCTVKKGSEYNGMNIIQRHTQSGTSNMYDATSTLL